MTELAKIDLQPPVLDEETKKLLARFHETVPAAKTTEPPTIWWSHKPAGWCVEEDAAQFECAAEKGWSIRPAFYDDLVGMWYSPEIVVVILAYRDYWFKDNDDGSQTRLSRYETGARRRIQYAALVHGLDLKQHDFAIVTTSRVSKSRELFGDIANVQAEVNKAFQRPAPLWTVWLRIGAKRDADGNVVYTKLPQGALVAPPRVLAVGYTRKEHWSGYAELATVAQAWATGQDDDVVSGQVVDIQ